ncbi:obg-like atpase 1 [Anaeramoeba flamelloides]|uniref:Obg-like atpase 1 n=1 Tax=Anaeramoeba flamelloides TaxID=1746091 RepID=A0ABQ8ZFA2_9EUKA|nr:obg-like atpase 1 [Anaeramoeba flamelloides]
MSKKNKKTETVKPVLGRYSGNLKMGLVGLSNVGKSLTFNLLTSMNVQTSNFAFCTIDPETARCKLPDPYFDLCAQVYKPKKQTPSYLTVVDIAGLIKGASKGNGLGLKFLSHIREVDGLFHVVRAFRDKTIGHVQGSVDPVRDLQIVEEELMFKDAEWVDKRIEGLGKHLHALDKAKKEEYDMLLKFKNHLCESQLPIRLGEWTSKEILLLNELHLLTSKPVVYLVNISAKDFKRKGNKWLRAIMQYIKERTNEPIIPFCPILEEQFIDSTEEEKKNAEFTSVLPKIISTGFKRLDLVTFYTCHNSILTSHKIRRGTTAKKAAGCVHTDMEAGFQSCEVLKIADLEECGTPQKAKNLGKIRQQGRNYIVEEGDIVTVKFNISGKSKKKK